MSTTKIGENTTIILNCYFRAKSTPSPIKLNTYMQEIKFTWHRQYLFGLLFSIKVKEGSYRLKYTSIFLICPNLNDPQTFKSSSWKYFFIAFCFDECFLFQVITGRCYFLEKVCRYCEVFSTVILSFFFKKKCFERSPYSMLSPKKIVLMLILSPKLLFLYILQKLSELTFLW